MAKTINQLTVASDSEANNDNFLFPLCNPTTGVSKKMTIAQAKAIFKPRSLKYVATGSEGTSLVIVDLAGKTILTVSREGGIIYEVTSSPDSTEYTWDLTTLTFGLTLHAGERLTFIYTNE